MNKRTLGIIAVAVLAAVGAFALLDDGERSRPAIGTGEYPTNLMILGNADLNDRLDQGDADLIRQLIGSGDIDYGRHYFADANFDGRIDEDDAVRVEKMIAGEWDELVLCYYLNADFEIASFDMTAPDRKLITLICPPLDDVLILNPDLLVGTDMRPSTGKYRPQYEGVLSAIEDRNGIELLDVGLATSPSMELIAQASRDNGGHMIVVCGGDSYGPAMEKTLADAGVQIIRIPTWEYGGTLPGLLSLAYLLDVDDNDGYDEMERAYDYMEWYRGVEEYVASCVSGIPGSERPGVSCVYAYTDPMQILGRYTGEYSNSLKLGIADVTGKYLGGTSTGGHGNAIGPEVVSELVRSRGLDVLVGMVGSPFQVDEGQSGSRGDQASYDGMRAAYDKWASRIGPSIGDGGAELIITGYSFFSGVSEPLGQLILGYCLYGEEHGFTLGMLKQKTDEYCRILGIYDVDGDGACSPLDGSGRPYEWCFDCMNLVYAEEGSGKNIMNREAGIEAWRGGSRSLPSSD